MASLRQVLANRANASFSTGPRSAAGIEHCKYNATRHGLSGKQIVTRDEDPAAYDSLRLQLARDLQPAGEREAMLVEEIAQNWWRLERARRVESSVIRKFGELECITDPDARKSFLTITRYLNTIQRTWNRASKDLEMLQNKREKEQPNSARTAGAIVAVPPKLSAVRRRFIAQSAPFRKPSTHSSSDAANAGLSALPHREIPQLAA